MRTTLKTAIAAAATVLTLAAAAAPGPRGFDAGDIDHRQARQSERIERAVARGEIDRQQLRSLRQTQREIVRAEARALGVWAAEGKSLTAVDG